MKRYAETFFRYWPIVLLPIIALTFIGYTVIRGTPKTLATTAKLWVDPSVASLAAGYNQWLTPAQNEIDTLNQLKQLSTFDWAVARSSAIYMHNLSKVSNPGDHVVSDLSNSVQFTPGGDNIVLVTYNSKDWRLGPQVVQGVIHAALNQAPMLTQETAVSLSYYQAQLRAEQKQLAQSTQLLSRYMAAHGYAPADMTALVAVNPTLASLYNQAQSDQTNYSTTRQKVTALQSQIESGAAGQQAGFSEVDSPVTVNVSSKKKELLNLAIYMIVGIVLGGGFLVTKTLLDRTLRYADDVANQIGLPVLTVLPYEPALATPRLGSSRSPKRSALITGPLGLRRSG
jgi:uncharacterized protein involved in exopolysaccharide biosynthesis